MSAWPHTDLPGAGRLDEHELDASCARKKVVHLTLDQCRAMDDTAGLCGTCGGECPSPQACQQPEPASRPFAFPLEPLLTRHPWLGPVLVTCVVIVWTCLDAYLETTP